MSLAITIGHCINHIQSSFIDQSIRNQISHRGILALLGDYIAQRSTNTADDGKVEYDVKRAGAFISFDIMYRAVQCALFPEITRICDGHFLGSIGLLHNHVDLGILATLEQTMCKLYILSLLLALVYIVVHVSYKFNHSSFIIL